MTSWPDEKLEAEMMEVCASVMDINADDCPERELVRHFAIIFAALRKTQGQLKEARLCIADLSMIANAPSGTWWEAQKRLRTYYQSLEMKAETP